MSCLGLLHQPVGPRFCRPRPDGLSTASMYPAPVPCPPPETVEDLETAGPWHLVRSTGGSSSLAPISESGTNQERLNSLIAHPICTTTGSYKVSQPLIPSPLPHYRHCHDNKLVLLPKSGVSGLSEEHPLDDCMRCHGKQNIYMHMTIVYIYIYI